MSTEKSPDPKRRLQTVPATAELLGIHPRSVVRLLESGQLQRVRLGRSVRITQQSIDQLIERGGTR